MSIIRVRHNKDYVVMNKTGLEDNKLSFKAKGLLAYLLSKPDNWTANISHLKKVSKDGRDSVRTGLQELEKNNYLTRKSIRNANGTIKKWESIITEVPVKYPETDYPTLDYPTLDNPTLINNDYNKYLNKLKTEEEETTKIIQKIKSKFQQIFNRQLSVEFYKEITEIYSKSNVILKALSICEKQADKPCYLLVILKDWKNNELNSVTEVNAYLENRQAQKKVKQSRSKTTATRPETPEEELQMLYEEGYK